MGSSSEMKSTSKHSKATENTDNVWSSILTEVRSNASTKMPSGKSIVVLGDNESGKTTLVAKLQGIEDPKKGCGLEYAYIEIRDEYRDDQTQLSVWVLDGNPSHANLLQYALSDRTFSETVIMLTVSMATPWTIIDQLQFWAGLLHDHVDSLKMSPDRTKELREKCVKRWLDYVEPGDELDIASGKQNLTLSNRNSRNLDEEPVLPPNTLVRNTGLDIVVVVTKTDFINTLEREHDYMNDEHFDFIQYHIRQFCIQYGAALFYTSVKEDKNCDLLYKYLVHRIYGLPFRTPALIVEKDAVFIPAGWDNDKKMAILHENMSTFKPDEYFNDVIQKPVATRKAVNREPEIEVEDEQRFLERQQVLLQQQSSNIKDVRSPAAHLEKQGTPKRTPPSGINPALPITTPKKGDTTSSERVLANFFNSLLSKKGASSSSSPNRPNDDSRSDAAAELDTLINKKKLNNSLNNSSDC